MIAACYSPVRVPWRLGGLLQSIGEALFVVCVSVQQSSGEWKETVSESWRPAVNAAEPPAGGQHGEQSMVGMGGVEDGVEHTHG